MARVERPYLALEEVLKLLELAKLLKQHKKWAKLLIE